MTDLQIIQELNNKIERNLTETDYISTNETLFTRNKNGFVNEISLFGCFITNLDNIVIYLKELKHLETLNLGYNKISDLTSLRNLKSLKSLNLSDNEISDISELAECVNLTNLFLYSNYISEISSLKKLTKLVELQLENNNIVDITGLKNLKELKNLNLGKNKIKELPDWITDLEMDFNIENNDTFIGIHLFENSIIHPPLEIVSQGKEAIKRFFAGKKVDNKELKIILLGNSTAGKTSLVKYLTEKEYPSKMSTHGVSLKLWKLKEPNHDFTASIWDFGGQEFYHATHKLFLTNNSFYLLLWDKNKNKAADIDTEIYTSENNLETKKIRHFHYEYWLKLIRNQYAPNADIITIQNKIDISKKEIINQGAIDKYGIKEQYQISLEEAAKGTNKYKRKYIDFEEDLKDFIEEFIKSKATLNEDAGKIPRYIDNIRKAIRLWNFDFLTFDDFSQKSKEIAKQGFDIIDDKDIEITIKYLRDTGVLLYFGYDTTIQNSILENYIFINPNYVTKTIYKILDLNNVQKNGGKFDFNHVVNSVKNEEEAKLFIALMKSPKFELIFEYNNSFYASQFLPVENRVINKTKKYLEFAFALQFPNFFSPSFIGRFITRYAKNSKTNEFCRTEIIIEQNNIDFYISADINKTQITIKTDEKGKTHPFIKEIYDTFLNLVYKDENIKVSLDNKKFASLYEIKNLELEEFQIERLGKSLKDKTIT